MFVELKRIFILGEILRGDRIVNTNFKVAMDTDVRCQTLCKNINIDKEKSATLGKRIRNNYYFNFNIFSFSKIKWSHTGNVESNTWLNK